MHFASTDYKLASLAVLPLLLVAGTSEGVARFQSHNSDRLPMNAKRQSNNQHACQPCVAVLTAAEQCRYLMGRCYNVRVYSDSCCRHSVIAWPAWNGDASLLGPLLYVSLAHYRLSPVDSQHVQPGIATVCRCSALLV